jgi:hypothetical protein
MVGGGALTPAGWFGVRVWSAWMGGVLGLGCPSKYGFGGRSRRFRPLGDATDGTSTIAVTDKGRQNIWR